MRNSPGVRTLEEKHVEFMKKCQIDYVEVHVENAVQTQSKHKKT